MQPSNAMIDFMVPERDTNSIKKGLLYPEQKTKQPSPIKSSTIHIKESNYSDFKKKSPKIERKSIKNSMKITQGFPSMMDSGIQGINFGQKTPKESSPLKNRILEFVDNNNEGHDSDF